MKKSEKDALKKAFDIPEPTKKKAFIAEYSELIKRKERRSRFPVFMKYASTAVFAAVAIVVIGRMNLRPDFSEQFNNGDLTSETAVTTAVDDAPEKTTVPVENAVETTEAKVTVVTTKKHDMQTSTAAHDTAPAPAVTAKTEPVQDNSGGESHSTRVTSTKAVSSAVSTAPVKATTASTRTTASAVSVSKCTTVKTSISVITQTVSTTRAAQTSSPVTTTRINESTAAVTITAACATEEPSIVTTTENSGNNSGGGSPPLNESQGNIYPGQWVTPSVKYQPSDHIVTVSLHLPPYESGGTLVDSNHPGGSPTPVVPGSAENIDPDIYKAYYYDASNVVYGPVCNIFYTSIGGIPYTQIDIAVYNSLKDDAPNILSIYTQGGYISPEDYYYSGTVDLEGTPEDTMLHSPSAADRLKVGEQYLFFLVPDGYEPFYLLLTGDRNCIFKENDGIFSSLGNEGGKFTYNDILSLT